MRRRVLPVVLLYVVLIAAGIVYLLPVYMAVITALKPRADINFFTTWQLPVPPTAQGFRDALSLLLPSFRNSLMLTVSATVISCFVGSINGYIFSKWKFRGSELIFILFLFGMFIPPEIILIPLFLLLRLIGLYGSIAGLSFTHIVYGIPIVTLIFRGFYDRLPDALLESGQLDGAGFFRIYAYLMLPLVPHAFVVVGIWQFTQVWNEFLWGITLTTQNTQPITVGLAQLAGGQAVSWDVSMAGALIAALPVIVVYLFLGRFFISGLLSGSVKG